MKSVSSVREHFEQIAYSYDSFKRRNWFYYETLKRLIQEIVEPRKKVLEIGCGTGEILACVEPESGVGIDISHGMVCRAKQKYLERSNLMFVTGTVDTVSESNLFDYILLVDVVEHLESVTDTIREIKRLSGPFTKIVLSMANPSWEPVLMILEKLKMKMPEGPHCRIASRDLIADFQSAGLQLRARKKHMHIPIHIKYVSEPLNRLFSALPLLRELGLIELMVFEIEPPHRPS